ncbi:MAG: hypothetical protein COB46_12430 [Rhodospirillaceae bacterium]|nr:MAG: hypothetical protein COB46_12430 [Rhodospirillaceae bacterium]
MMTEFPKGWETCKLGEICKIKARIGWRGLSANEYTEDGPFLIAGKHIRDGQVLWGNCDHISEWRYDESPEIQIQEGDVILSKDGTIGRPAHILALPDKTTINGTMMLLRPETQKLDPAYLFQQLGGFQFKTLVKERISGGSIPHIFQRDMVNLPIARPPLEEQKKIAEVLSSVDEAIRATQAVIEQTRTVKKGLLQKFFHRGDWEPNKDKALPDEFEVRLLDDLAKRGSGHTPNKKKTEYWGGGIKWVSLQDTKKLDRLYIKETTAEISDLGITNSSAVLHPKGMVVLSRDATVGKSAITTEPMAVSQHFIAWDCGPDLDRYYFYYWLQHMKPVFLNIGAGSTIKTIGLSFFKKLGIPIPAISEQRRVGQKMKELDELLFLHEQKLTQLKTLKAGLMSDLLTGRVRVKVAS